jgi:hypothetical protein
MKVIPSALLALCVPSFSLALVGNTWKFTKAPKDGFTEITFPLNMAHATHTSGYYYAQQFNFKNSSLGYTGLQPRPNDKTGRSIVHAAFSSFMKGATTAHKNCHAGADGGPGVSCAVDIEGNYNNTYNLIVEESGERTWKGTLFDTETKKATVIGEWTLPVGTGRIMNGQLGFVEYYPWNDGKNHSCTDLPWTEATFFNPTSNTKGASGGSIISVYEYGDCKRKAGFVLKKVEGGYDVECGFPMQP